MKYLLSKIWSYESTCMVEADSLEEAKKLAADMDWNEDETLLDKERYKVIDADENIDEDEIYDMFDEVDWEIG